MDEITLRNFRCFREEQTARVAPLTLLVGENSTGKSSFLAVIRALWDIAYLHRVPDFKEEPFDLGSFDEIAHHRGARGGQADEFGAGFSILSRGRHRRKGLDGPAWCFEVTFCRGGTAPVPLVRRLLGNETRIEIRHDPPEFSFATPGRSWSVPMPNNIRLGANGEDDRTVLPFFVAADLIRYNRQVLVNVNPATRVETSSPVDTDFELVEQFVDQFSIEPMEPGRPYASGPVRSIPRRTYDPARTTKNPEGDYVPMFLASKFLQNKNEWKELQEHIIDFGLRQAKPWKGGSDELETFHRKPAGSTPVRQRRSPPAGSECCMACGNACREAYTAGGEATNIEPRNNQCWCLHCFNGGGSTGSAAMTRRDGPAGVAGTIAKPREGLPGNLGGPNTSVWDTVGGDEPASRPIPA